MNKIVFLGASIVQGRISYNFVNILKARYGTRYEFINRGIAGYEAYNVLKNLDGAIALKPDVVVILVGTNDVVSSLDPKLARISRKLKKIPHEPTLFYYTQDISAIIKRLRDETHAVIAVASLPILGEDLDSIENLRIDEYNNELKNVATNEKVAYLPINETQKKYLTKEFFVSGAKGQGCVNPAKRAFEAMFLHYMLFRSFESISAKNGFKLLTDGMHLNKLGATMIAGEISLFLEKIDA